MFISEEEQRDFLRVTGEYGRSSEARLGVDEGYSVEVLACLAQRKVSAWHGKAGRWMMPRSYVEAAIIVARFYEEMYYHLSALSEE